MKMMLAAALTLSTVAAQAAPAPDFSGRWEVAVREYGQKNFYLPMTDGRLVVADDGSASFGHLSFAGTVEKDGLHLTCSNAGRPCGTLVLNVSRAGLTGSGSLIRGDGTLPVPVTLAGRRPAPRPAAATAHVYDPKEFHPFYSPGLPPVLRIFPGDSVSTRTADSRGQDRDGLPKAPRGNPQTGPFYVEGAMPGDTLVVHLTRLRTNRDTAYQTNQVANNALETGLSRPCRRTAALPPGRSMPLRAPPAWRSPASG